MSPHPKVYSIAPDRPFADALAGGLIARVKGDKVTLARGLILLPNNRAQRAIQEAFVRRSEGGLLLPRLVSIGDPALDQSIGAALDPVDAAPVPPAIDPLARQLILARLVEEARARAGQPVDGGEAMRLAADLGRLLDQLIVEEIDPTKLRGVVPVELAGHWEASLAMLELILARWPEELARRGRIDLADRRNRLLDRAAQAWGARPPAGFVVAAGISAAGPAVGRLLHRIARLERGMVVLADLDHRMSDREWAALEPDPSGEGEDRRPLETHPQYAIRRLLDRMSVGRREVRRWRGGGVPVAARGRSIAIGNAMAAARFTDAWRDLPAHRRRLSNVRAIELATPAAEAQAIAIALRGAIETPGRTAALVTPDRALAARVVAHLKRWGIEADDSAGRPLSLTAPGTLLLAIAEAVAEDFAPVALMALLQHPLVRAGEPRGDWLAGVRRLDRALRGPRPGPGLAGIAAYLAAADEREARVRRAAAPFWAEVEALLRPLIDPITAVIPDLIRDPASSSSAGPGSWIAGEARDDVGWLRDDVGNLATLLATIREAATALGGEAVWGRAAGRAAAELLAALEDGAHEGPRNVDRASLPALLRVALDGVAVRPQQGGHPRILIWGLIEARLQQADLMILGGLNEGVWPSLPSPDPWLAPAIRHALKLPGLERRIGAEAQEFAAGLGAPEVLLTRARRDARSPTVASRFWLRLQAMTGGLPGDRALCAWAEAVDDPRAFAPAGRPAPRPPIADRPKRIAVTKLDRLKADPFAFYADAMLRLREWDPIDADPSAAWRGTAVHRILDEWAKQDGCDPTKLKARAEALLLEAAAHPVLRAFWTPRLMEAIDWIAARLAEQAAAGRRVLDTEIKGQAGYCGITLDGTADRIDRLPDGTLAIVDYKTGKPPSKAAVQEGYAMQLGLLGLIAEEGGFEGIEGVPMAFDYWSLAAGKDRTLGFEQSAVGLDRQGNGILAEDFTAMAGRNLRDAVEKWLTGDAPFTAKLNPTYAPYGDHDQLMRLDEWYGRQDEAEHGVTP